MGLQGYDLCVPSVSQEVRVKLVLAAGRVKMISAVGVALAVFPLRQLLSLRRVFRLKVSLETVLWLRAAPTAFRLIFTRPEASQPVQPAKIND